NDSGGTGAVIVAPYQYVRNAAAMGPLPVPDSNEAIVTAAGNVRLWTAGGVLSSDQCSALVFTRSEGPHGSPAGIPAVEYLIGEIVSIARTSVAWMQSAKIRFFSDYMPNLLNVWQRIDFCTGSSGATPRLRV